MSNPGESESEMVVDSSGRVALSPCPDSSLDVVDMDSWDSMSRIIDSH